MELTINGETHRFDDGDVETVDEMLEALGVDERRGVAVAVDDEVVAKSDWDETVLGAGDRVEIIRAAQGG